MPKTVLIVSSGRTGTQFLARYFDGNFDDVVARHEPRPRRSLRLAVNAYAAGDLSRAALCALLQRKRRRHIDPIAAPLYVESNPFLWGAVSVVDEVFDAPRVVHIVRDPREQVRSSLNHGTARGVKGLANRWLPYWSPPVNELPELAGDRDWLARASALWSVVNRRLRDEASACRHYTLLKYEDLFDESQSGLRELCSLLGLEFRGDGAPVDPTRRINRSRLDLVPSWEGWTDEQCQTLDRICSPLMEEYGYGREPAWLSRLSRDRAARR